MNRRELLTGAAALAAYGSLPAPADALTLSQSLELLGGAQVSQFIITFDDPDTVEYILTFDDPDTNEYILIAGVA